MLYEEFHKLPNSLKREEQHFTDPYPWLTDDNERRNLTDCEILENHIDLRTSCLTQKEKEELTNILYRYKETFNFRDEIAHGLI